MEDRQLRKPQETPAVPPDPIYPIPQSGIVPGPPGAPDLKHNLAIVDHFKVPGWEQMLANEALDTDGTKGKIYFIEQYLGKRINELGLKDEDETYRELLRGMESHFQFTGLHRHDVRINKIFSYLQTLSKSEASNAKLLTMIQKANQESEKRRL